ncbi:unnamed protein product, partial [Pylaiella littoralis]
GEAHARELEAASGEEQADDDSDSEADVENVTPSTAQQQQQQQLQQPGPPKAKKARKARPVALAHSTTDRRRGTVTARNQSDSVGRNSVKYESVRESTGNF